HLGTPDEIYDHPVNEFVAAFIGSPSMNLIGCRLQGSAVSFGASRLELPPRALEERPGLTAFDGRDVVLGIRPEDFRSGGEHAIELVANRVESLGSELIAYLDSGVEGTEITARLERRTEVQEGQPVRLSVDPGRLYFFDPDGGKAI